MNSRLRWLGQLRGAFVGAVSASAGITGHALGGGTAQISTTGLLLLMAACVLPAVVAGGDHMRRRAVTSLIGLLTLGQLLGHVTLSISPGHHGAGHSLLPSLSMVAAHVGAAAVAALVIIVLERSLLAALGIIADIIGRWLTKPATSSTPAILPVDRPLPRGSRGLWQAYGGTRAPPIGA